MDAGPASDCGRHVAVVVLLGRFRARPQPLRRPLRGRRTATIVFACVATVAVLVPQRAAISFPGGPVQHLSTSLSTYQHMLAGSKGDVFVVGNERSDMGTSMSEQASLGNPGTSPANRFRTRIQRCNMRPMSSCALHGCEGESTCSLALYHLFDIAPGTGKRWVESCSASRAGLLIKSTFLTDAWSHPRPGFHLVSDTPQTRLLVRNTPIPGAGWHRVDVSRHEGEGGCGDGDERDVHG